MMRKLIWFTAGMITLAIAFSASVILFLTTQVAGFSTLQHASLPLEGNWRLLT
jgi:hypothetical protein